MSDFTKAGGEVAKRLKGTVNFFSTKRGFGFATLDPVQDAGLEDIVEAVRARNPDGGVLLGYREVNKTGLSTLVEGQPITFEAIAGEGKSLLAVNICLVGENKVFVERYVATVDKYSHTERIGFLVVAPDTPHISFRFHQAAEAGYCPDQIRHGLEMPILETLDTGKGFIVLKFEPT